MNLNIPNNKGQIIALLAEAYEVRINNLPRSIELAKKALAISKEIDDKTLIGKSLNELSLFYLIMSDFDQSKKSSEEAIVYFEEMNNEAGIADAKYNIGSVYYKTNNYQLGLIYLIEALKIYKRRDDFYNQSRVQKAIGTIYEYIGDQHNAFKSYKTSIKLAKEIGNHNLESNVYNNLSGLFLKRQKTKTAMSMIEHSIALKKQTKDIRGYAFAIYGKGKVNYKIGELKQAEANFLEALGTHKEIGEKTGTAMAFNKLGTLYLNLNLLEKAEQAASEGLELSIKYNMSMLKIKNYYLLYSIFKKGNDKIKALEYLEYYFKEKEAVINVQTLKVIENYATISKMNGLEREAQLQKERREISEKKNRDDEESARLKQEFLSIMSHEIRTPLNAITTIVSILNNQVDNESKKMLNSLQFASNNLISIVNDILDFNKLDSNKAKLEKYPSNIEFLCTNIFNIYENMASEKGLQLLFTKDAFIDKSYMLDETKITQILGNLISNAIKFTDKGQVEFSVKLVREGKKYDRLLFKVADTGEGISEKNLAEIFVSFSQIKPVMTRKQGGTGLGLAIVKMLVELHDSKIKVKSELGKGSEFYFQLKLKKATADNIIKKEDVHDLKGRLALIVEDTPINALLMKKLLSNWGILTEHVLNGNLAIEQAKLKKYDFILMDIHMPEMNGFEATKLIKTQDNLNKNTPIFAVTADIMTQSDKNNICLFNGFLLKPLEIGKLYAALANEI